MQQGCFLGQEDDDGDGDVVVTISDDALDPGEEALHPRVDAGSGVGTTGPVAYHSDQDELAWRGKNLLGVDGVDSGVHIWGLIIFSPFSATVRGPPLSPWQVSVP